jgi:AcrR family transcriptional regulator
LLSERSLTIIERVPRATPLPPDERRAALIAATEPLLEQFGREVSTRQIAEAAGIAEGTIFRVFATKESLIDAVLEEVFDNQRVCDQLAVVDPALDLDARLVCAVTILQGRLRRIFALFHTLRLSRQPPENPEEFRRRQLADNERLDAALAALLKPDADRLRFDVADAASMLRTVTFALTHPILGDAGLSDAGQIVDLVLHGITHPSTPSKRTSC